MVALADDLRLGMFVISRLAHRHGITVTLRSSPYGGTTAIVLIPHEVVVREVPGSDTDADADAVTEADADTDTDAGTDTVTSADSVTAADDIEHAEAPEPEEPVREPRPVVAARTASARTASASASAPTVSAPAADRRPGTGAPKDGLTPLPRRVPQTSLAAELREEAPAAEENGHADDFTAERAAASLMRLPARHAPGA